jgi:Flp pilus assembly protein TadG
MAKHMRRLGRHSRERGMAIIFYATMLFFVIGSVGLAVDVGTIYMIKARLSAATDAAALAAGRSVNLALTLAQAQSNAITTANQFFAANFPNGYFNTIGSPTVTPLLTQETDVNGNPNGVLDIQVSASVKAPTYFMNIFNVSNINVGSNGVASRRGLVLMLVLDISSSMGNGAGSSCAAMVTAAQNFITLFSPYDQIGLVTFDLTAHMLDAPTTSRTQVNTDIGNITCGSNTNTISALDVAYQQIKAANLPLALNTIVLFTDGSPNGISAQFPARVPLPYPGTNESRWSPGTDGTTPTETGSTFSPSITNSCNLDSGSQISALGNANTNAICINMPVVCTDSTATLTGTLAQWGNQNSYGGDTYGLVAPTDANGKRTISGYDTSTVSIPASCNPGGATENIRQYLAYIPDTDIYGNNLRHGVVASGTSPNGTITGGFDTRENWIFQVNNECSNDSTVQPNCKNIGGLWSSFPTIGTGSNFFPSTNTLYANANVYGAPTTHLRPDQSNTVVAASMNGTMSEAFTIRSDTTYHPVIHTIYLTGNSFDSVDREFLAIVANYPNIISLPYDPGYNSQTTPITDPVLYANPAYRTDQETGKYLVTSDKNALSGLFAQLASEVLRLSH